MKNKLNTRFKELYPTFQDYQKYEASARLGNKEMYFIESYNQHVDLLKLSEYEIKLYELEDVVKKALDNREYLKMCIAGIIEDPIYKMYYNHLYNC
jgi:hypothetical protein